MHPPQNQEIVSMDFLWGFFAGVATMIIVAIAFSFVVFFLTPDEMEEEFALRVRDLPGSVPNLPKSVPEFSNIPVRLADRKTA
jgi:hypothetical protein